MQLLKSTMCHLPRIFARKEKKALLCELKSLSKKLELKYFLWVVPWHFFQNRKNTTSKGFPPLVTCRCHVIGVIGGLEMKVPIWLPGSTKPDILAKTKNIFRCSKNFYYLVRGYILIRSTYLLHLEVLLQTKCGVFSAIQNMIDL